MLRIERWMSALAEFIACDLFRLDSRDIERIRDMESGRSARHGTASRDDRQIVVRFGR